MQVKIGVFGGSGFYSLFEEYEELKVDTPYGPPSDKIAIGRIGNWDVAFLPRHGRDHSFPPHRINYRANIWAFHHLGVERIIAPCSAGSLQPHIKPSEFVICDQFVDRTRGRVDTFYDGPTTIHISTADPYCPQLRQLAIEWAEKLGVTCHPEGTVVVIQGPRFSTKSESQWFTKMGWEVINMTQYPEVALARELAICYVNISLITDWDVGLVGQVEPVSAEEVTRVFQQNNEKVKKLIYSMIENMPEERTCSCKDALKGAIV